MVQKKQLDQYDILAEAMLALRDENQSVKVSTLGSKSIGFRTWLAGTNDEEYIPTQFDKFGNRWHAKSIKIGKDITIKRIARPRVRVKTDKHEYDVDMGSYYVVRTPNGEAKLPSTDEDMQAVWGYALSVYYGNLRYGAFDGLFRNKKVYKAYAGPMVQKSKKTKYEQAIEQLEALRVEPKKLMAYIAKREKQNG